MNIANVKRMTVDEYVVWSRRQFLGRYELIEGQVIQMNAECMGHMRAKSRIANALDRALKVTGLAGETCWDGMAVRIDDKSVHEPDAMLRLGELLPSDAMFVDDPLVVVEVLSPSTGPVDNGLKLANCFSLPSVRHYLVVDTTKEQVLHYVRDASGQPVMHPPVLSGDINLTPPGLVIALAEIF